MQTVTQAKARAAVAYLERADGRILCVWNKRYGGWGMPGGMVEDHETVTEGLVRELREETGLELDGKPEKIWDGPPLTAQKEKGRGSHVYVFRVWFRAGYEPREKEVGAPVTWLSREEFLRFSPFAEFYRPMFASFEAVCRCRDIQKDDPLRHFRECPMRKPLPAGHPQSDPSAEAKHLRSMIDRDRTGLGSALSGVRAILDGFSWLGNDGEWGSYHYTEQTVNTLRREFRSLIGQARSLIRQGLADSGARADHAFYPLRPDRTAALDDLLRTVVALQNELAALKTPELPFSADPPAHVGTTLELAGRIHEALDLARHFERNSTWREVLHMRELIAVLEGARVPQSAVRAAEAAARLDRSRVACDVCQGRGWHVGECHPQEACGACDGLGTVLAPESLPSPERDK